MECFGCDRTIPDEVGRYYCDTCLRAQLEDEKRERQAFEDYHAFADAVAKVTK